MKNNNNNSNYLSNSTTINNMANPNVASVNAANQYDDVKEENGYNSDDDS